MVIRNYYFPLLKKKKKEVISNLIKSINFKYMFVFNGISIIKVDNTIENSLPHTRKTILFYQKDG